MRSKKRTTLWMLAVLLLSSVLMSSLACFRVEASSGTDTLSVEPSTRENLTKALQIGQKIEGKVTVSEGDNYIVFKVYDPIGNPCLWRNVLNSLEFSWGPVNFAGEYLFVFDNWYDSSNTNTVTFEYKITSTDEDSFPMTIVAAIALILVAFSVALLVFVRRRVKNTQASSSESGTLPPAP